MTQGIIKSMIINITENTREKTAALRYSTETLVQKYVGKSTIA